MNNNSCDRPYDLEQRTFQFAKESRTFVKQLPRTITNFEDVKQLVRAPGSIGANDIEAHECIGKKDFAMKIKTCRREAKESAYWLRLLHCSDNLERKRSKLADEALELMKIFGAIARKSGSLNFRVFHFFKLFGTSKLGFRYLPKTCGPNRNGVTP